VRYRLLFCMTVAGACDRAEQEIAGMENRISGAARVIIDRVADVQLKDDGWSRNGRARHALGLLPTPCPQPSR
jgi:hypothetical protein